MSWAELFERAAAYGVDEAAVRAALAERRGGGPTVSGSDEGDGGGGDGEDRGGDGDDGTGGEDGDDAPEADGP